MSWLLARRRMENPDWLEVVRLGRREWRVSDLRVAPGDSTRLLGYVERVSPRRYEVMWMGDPMKWGYVDSLAGALVGIAEVGRFTGTHVARRDEPLPRGRALVHRIRRRVADRKNTDVYVA
jgi:hypothetical protein